jgi:hypothetical protein
MLKTVMFPNKRDINGHVQTKCLFSMRPSRDTAIAKEDLHDLMITLMTTHDVLQFLVRCDDVDPVC